MTKALNQTEIDAQLSDRTGWIHDAEKHAICRAFGFSNFVEAFGFMTQVAFIAEKFGHHPDWSNSYNKVLISLSTHAAGGVTEKDFELAEKANVAFES